MQFKSISIFKYELMLFLIWLMNKIWAKIKLSIFISGMVPIVCKTEDEWFDDAYDVSIFSSLKDLQQWLQAHNFIPGNASALFCFIMPATSTVQQKWSIIGFW